jgi:hypothetical protein
MGESTADCPGDGIDAITDPSVAMPGGDSALNGVIGQSLRLMFGALMPGKS